MLPATLVADLKRHLRSVKAVHESDLRDGWGQVVLPYALLRKYPNAAREWSWQWVFPQATRWRNHQTGEQGRHHSGSIGTAEGCARSGSTGGFDQVGIVIPFGTRLPRIFLRMAMTSERCRSCSVIGMSERP
jgi:hypothetical protein